MLLWRPRLVRRLAIVGLLLIAALTVLRALAPLEAIRREVVDRLADRLGTHVSLRAVRFSWLGQVCLDELRIGPPGQPTIRARAMSLDLGWLDLLAGRTRPRSCTLEGVEVFLERGRDAAITPLPLPRGSAGSEATLKPRNRSTTSDNIIISLENGTITWMDRLTNAGIILKDVQLDATAGADQFVIDQLSAECNGGQVTLAACLDARAQRPRLSGEIRVENVAVDPATGVLAFLCPLTAGSPPISNAQLELRLRFLVVEPAGPRPLENLSGEGYFLLSEIKLADAPLVRDLVGMLGLPERARLGSLESAYVLHHDRLTTERGTLRIGSIPLAFVGSTYFDGRLDYSIHADGLGAQLDYYAERLSPDAHSVLRSLNLPKKLGGLADLHLGGTLDQLSLSVRDRSGAAPASAGKRTGARALAPERIGDRTRNGRTRR